ncbi:MAG TPA: POTRA domain-containing protein [Chitinophagaceae bacterium]|jgi:outer membrane protein insertion porin family|nr:POTRA domain-containing protein [Chitinophagaceae bacterium]
MQKTLQRLSVILLTSVFSTAAFSQQSDTLQPTSLDPKLIEYRNARIPKEYVIAGIEVSGIKHLDTSIVASISGLLPGDKYMHPGEDIFAKAITALWKQRLFSNVQVYVTKIEDNKVWVELNVQERAKLGDFKFYGINKSEEEDIMAKVNLAKQTIVTENTIRETKERISKFFSDKGYLNISVDIQQKPDTTFSNSVAMDIYIKKGQKVHIDGIHFYGNENVDGWRLKKQMKGTKEMSRITLHPDQRLKPSPFGSEKAYSFKEYIKDWGFLTISKTKRIVDPYFRFKLSGSKLDPKKFEEDREKLIDYYNSLGFRDAQITDTAMSLTQKGNLNLDFKIEEGRKYYFGNITWKGNSKYSDSLLTAWLGINKGDTYNLGILNKKLGKEASQEGGDISSQYMDDGYLFFRVEPVETAVYNDTIDHEIRITEGPQARIKNVTIAGNDKTKDHVIRRELRTVPGDLFSRSEITRSIRELANLQFFNQEKIEPGVVPNADDGTVDINWKLEEKSSDQLELSAGWGGGIGLTGTLGVTFNNFSIRNIWKKSAWDPLPMGDGQKLSLRVQSSGKAYQSYSFSFTEPWLGGKKRNSLSFSLNKSNYKNGRYDPITGKYEFDANTSLKTFGAGISLGKQLKWPDDYFSLVYTLNYTQYKRKNYNIFPGAAATGNSNNLSLKIAIQRSSVFNPIYPTSGSNFVASVQLTPPYSLLKKDIVNSDDPYKNPEYHKWKFNAEWYVPIGKALGAEKNRQFVLKLAAKFGFMGRYNGKLDFSPFERFQVGDAGLTNNFGLLGYDIVAHRGYPIYQSSNPTLNPDVQSQANQFFTIFNKYTLEARFPVVTNPSSTIYALTFFEAANGWYNYKDYNPFRLRRSVGVGMRFFLPMFGLLGFDYGIGLDRLTPGQSGLKGASRFTFMLGFEPE